MSNLRPMDVTCKEVVELITDYLEGALSLEERTRFEQHLVTCPGCKAYLRQIRQTIDASRRLTEESLPSGIREELLDVFREWRKGRTG
jgi:anti-sigma factor RsiW